MTSDDDSWADRMRGAMGRMLPWAAKQPFVPPQKALILQPCCLGRVMMTTPLLAALGEAFPEARFDWAISDWALQAISSNRRVTRTIRSGPGDLAHNTREETRDFLEAVQREGYDTCFIASRSPLAARLARQAGIPQRVGLDTGERLGYTVTARPPAGERRTARCNLALAAAAGVEDTILNAAEMEFAPTDSDRVAVARWLVEEFDWLGDAPLVVLHPGGGDNPERRNLDIRWPAYRFARLANHLRRAHGARIVLVGLAEERPLAGDVAGMIPFPAANRAGQVGLGQLAALCELAGLYVGNDNGATHIAAATGCPTLAIYGPTDPAANAPYMVNGRVRALWRPCEGAFNWANGVSVDEASAAADTLLTAYSLNDAVPG